VKGAELIEWFFYPRRWRRMSDEGNGETSIDNDRGGSDQKISGRPENVI
jgi:hypothetical protein